MCLGRLLELNNHVYCAVGIQREIGEISRELAVAIRCRDLGLTLRAQNHRQDEDRYHRHKEEPKPG